MDRWHTKLTTTFSLKRRTSPAIVPAPLSPCVIGQTPGTCRSVRTPPLHSTLPSHTSPESLPNDNENDTHTPLGVCAISSAAPRWRTKFFSTIARKRTPLPDTQPSVFPMYPATRSIGPAILVSSFVIAAPAHIISLPAMAFEDTSDDNTDLSQAKSALRVLSALGDGVVGVPWLKGAAALGIEIVNTLDVSRPARQAI